MLNILDLDILELDIFGEEREREHFQKSDCEESGSSRLGSVDNCYMHSETGVKESQNYTE